METILRRGKLIIRELAAIRPWIELSVIMVLLWVVAVLW